MIAVCIPSIGRSGDMLDELLDVLLDEPQVTAIEIWDNSSGYHHNSWGDAKIETVYAPGMSIYQEWNAFAREWGQRADMAFLNDDIVMAPGTLNALQGALSEVDLVSVAARPNEARVGEFRGLRECEGTYRQGGICGWAFMVRKGAWPEGGIDERLKVWYGDDDLVWKMRRVGVVEGVTVRHVQSTTVNTIPDVWRMQQADADVWFNQMGGH